MKKLVLLFALFLAFATNAQESYFTMYAFTVLPKDQGTIYQLVNDFYSKNKPEGVTVSLYENHFADAENKATHSIVFNGTLDALGNMYGGEPNDSFKLFLTQLNSHISEGGQSLAGHSTATFGDNSMQYPIQRYYLLDVEDQANFEKAFAEFSNKHTPAGMLVITGTISAGQSPHGENRWVISGFKDFKAALGGANKLISGPSLDARNKAWGELMANFDSHGGVRLVRDGMRVLMGQW